MTDPLGADWNHLVDFLEARILEQESAVRAGAFASGTADDSARDEKASLSQLMLEECVQKRAIIASWREAADAEGITDLSDAEGTVAIARRSMLTILAGSHRDHPDYDPAWSPELPTDLAGDPGSGVRLQ